jgi:hypothetical protein
MTSLRQGGLEKTQKDQVLHELINKIKCICMCFKDHKQEVFNLVTVPVHSV